MNSADWFFGGLSLGLVACALIFVILGLANRPGVHRESSLPTTCVPGDQVVLATPVPVEFYVCKAGWVRK